MAAINKATVFVTGKLFWAKVLGEPRMNFSKDGREWTFELELTEESLEKIKKAGLADRIKGKGYNIGQNGQHATREPFLQLKKKELTKGGGRNTPIRVYNAANEEWDQDTLIGNESVADVKLDVRDYGLGMKKGVYPSAIRVKKLVRFESSEFGGMDENVTAKPSEEENDPFAAPPAKKPVKKVADNFADELDDEIPV